MMATVIELEITKTRRGYRYRIIDASGAAKANVSMYTSSVRSSALADVRANLSDTGKFAGNEASLRAVGRLLYNLVIRPVPEIETFLQGHSGPLFISTDDPEMPLELLHDDQDYLGLRLPIGRGILWSETAPAPVTLQPKEQLSILVVADPAKNLPGARAEAEALTASLPGEVDFKVLTGENASFVNVLKEISSGEHSAIHYAGHIGTLDSQGERQAYLELGSATGGTSKILASELSANLRGNPFVYLNGCSSSGRLRGAVGRYTENLARALVRGGAIGLIGTLWDVPDLTTGLVSQYFYQAFLAGAPAGEALRRARLAAREAAPQDPSWAAPILYGDPGLQLSIRPAGAGAEGVIGMDESAAGILNQAVREARQMNHPGVSSAHLLLALLESPSRLLAQTLAQLSFSAEGLAILVRQSMRAGIPEEALRREDQVTMSESVYRAIDGAGDIAQQEGARKYGERHLLVVFLQARQGSIFNVLSQVGLDVGAILARLGARPGRPVDAPAPAAQSAPPLQREAGWQAAFNLDLFDQEAAQVLELAVQEAGFAMAGLTTAHLLAAMLEKKGSYLAALLSQQGLQSARLAQALRTAQGYQKPAGSLQTPPAGMAQPGALSSRVSKILDLAVQIARQEGSTRAGERHLLAALLQDGGGSSARTLAESGVGWEQVQADMGQYGDQPPPPQKTPLLNKLGRDLTELARQGKLNPVIGRKRELEQIVLILSKDTKNNPVLVGEAGVGKTAVVEALAQHIAEGKIPARLKSKRLIEISMAGLVAGTRYRGDFEERIQDLINEARNDPDVIVFIDEIHTLVGAGEASGGLDAANMLKPALARGELHCIGATTYGEYQRTIAKDPALQRRFEQVVIEEPSAQDTLEILRATRMRYETRYQVTVSEDALSAAVSLSIQYLPELRLPDKARDLLEEACARQGTGTMSQWGVEGSADQAGKRAMVTAAAIASVIAERKHLPVEALTVGEQEGLLKLEESLGERVIGQEAAVQAVAQAVRIARSGLKDPRRPQGVFLFIGPTGVGKTELAKALAEQLFGSEDQIIRLDMSEYMEGHSVSKLIGAPPGYLGHDEEGLLVKALRRKPYSVVLIDEIEKAAPAIYDLFLQLFDEGRITDSQGQAVDGRHAFYIMTSNLGSELVERPGLGFLSLPAEREAHSRELFNQLRQTFRPEFLNRIDEIIIFHALSPEAIHQIARIQIGALQARIAQEHGAHLEVSEEVVAFICSQGYNERLGARPLQRAIMKLLAVPVSERLLASRARRLSARLSGDQIEISSDESEYAA
jgi:ATP-dependent Clp protease ATP-binding subunit ClpC